MALDATLLSTQHYKVRIKGKVEQFWEWSSGLSFITNETKFFFIDMQKQALLKEIEMISAKELPKRLLITTPWNDSSHYLY